MEKEQQFFSVTEAARVLGVSRGTVQKLITNGRLPAANFGTETRARWGISVDDIREFGRPTNTKAMPTARKKASKSKLSASELATYNELMSHQSPTKG